MPSVTFDYTGAVQYWTVPDDADSPVRVSLSGAQGADQANASGGLGGLLVTDLDVTPGEQLAVYVAGAGVASGAGGFGGGGAGSTTGTLDGGGGGGASDIRRLATGVPQVVDTFTRADSALSLGATETWDFAWEALGSSVYGIVGNSAYFVSGSNGPAHVVLGEGAHYLTGTFIWKTGSSIALHARYPYRDTAMNKGVRAFTSGGALGVNVAGVDTTSITAVLQDGATYLMTLLVEASGAVTATLSGLMKLGPAFATFVQATLTVNGSSATGANFGPSADIRLTGTATMQDFTALCLDLVDGREKRLAVAGGGGAAAARTSGPTVQSGGHGGGLIGGTGALAIGGALTGGGGGTQSAGGAGGITLTGEAGEIDGRGEGGDQGTGQNSGGAGGGGYFAGGGGSGGNNPGPGGGGGGGSSGSSGDIITNTQGSRAGNGQVTVEWDVVVPGSGCAEGGYCPVPARVRALRITELDADGSPAGSGLMVVTAAVGSLTISPETERGTVINFRRPGGTVLPFRGPDIMVGWRAQLALATFNPQASELLLGGTVLGGGAGYQVGAAGSVRTPVTLSGRVSVEVWTDALEGSETDPTLPYLHWVLPETTWTLGAPIALAYQPADLIVDGRLYDNPNWGDGPAGDWPYDSSSAWQWAGTDLLPEPFACDYQTAGS